MRVRCGTGTALRIMPLLALVYDPAPADGLVHWLVTARGHDLLGTPQDSVVARFADRGLAEAMIAGMVGSAKGRSAP